ncbi:MAG: FitA-like ribbon-helix-helix domain-containing protein [Dermatophilaceae bacterium]
MVVALQIRNVPDEIRDALTERARREGRSLQSVLLEIIEQEAGRSRNVSILDSFRHRSDGSHVGAEETASEIASLRRERDHIIEHR